MSDNKLNIPDRVVAYWSPIKGVQRAASRKALASFEGGKSTKQRKQTKDNSSGTAVVAASGDALRGTARALEQNYDVVNGALNLLVDSVVGSTGITREPRPKDNEGNIHTEFAAQINSLWEDFSKKPDVTHQHDYASLERLGARTLFRDGEFLSQLLVGPIASLRHGTRVPLSIEMIEIDQLPFSLNDPSKGIVNGVELNGWGRPRAFHVYKEHPGDSGWNFNLKTKRVPADRMIHPKLTSRIGQVRGVTVFHSVMTRLEDVKEYEESERVAARVAAALTGVIIKGTPDDYVAPDSGDEYRDFGMTPGMIANRLEIGESVATIESNRPSTLLVPFHGAMIRYTAAGIGVSYSSLAKDYGGTYSAQRQELVEAWIHNRALTVMFAGQFSIPVWEKFISASILSGELVVPDNVDMNTIYDADFRGPPMPWIDPVREETAAILSERAIHKTAQQIIRERGGNPIEVLKEAALWKAKLAENDMNSSALEPMVVEDDESDGGEDDQNKDE